MIFSNKNLFLKHNMYYDNIHLQGKNSFYYLKSSNSYEKLERSNFS